MSSIPNRNEEPVHANSTTLYSESDMEHLFARREARRDLDRLSGEVLSINRKMAEASAKQAVESEALRGMITALPNQLAVQITRCREEIRKEMQDSHPTRLENLEMRNHIENRVKEVDTTLERQIAAVDRKLSEEIKGSHSLLSEQIKTSHAELKNDLKIQWLKVSIPVAVVISIAGAITWVITTGLQLIKAS